MVHKTKMWETQQSILLLMSTILNTNFYKLLTIDYLKLNNLLNYDTVDYYFKTYTEN